MAEIGHKILGIDVTIESADQRHPLGMVVNKDDGTSYVYVKVGAVGIEAGDAVKGITGSTPFSGVLTSAAATDLIVGVAHMALTASYYGFVQKRGIITGVKTTDASVAGNSLCATSTAGNLGTAVSTYVTQPVVGWLMEVTTESTQDLSTVLLAIP